MSRTLQAWRRGATLMAIGWLLGAVGVSGVSAPTARGASQGAVFASQATSAGPNWRPGEASVAVNPRNPRNVVIMTTEASDVWQGAAKQEMPDFRLEDYREGFFMKCGLSVSYDGGTNWLYRNARDVIFRDAPPSPGGCIDPVVDFGPDGTVYMVAVCWPQRPGDGPAICAASSKDGGRTWASRVPISGLAGDLIYPALAGEQPQPNSGAFDRPYLSVDQRTGTVTVNAINRTGPLAGTNRYLMVSQDKGRTFSFPRPSPMDGPQSAANGLVAAYATGQLWITKDDGVTWKGTAGPKGVSTGQAAADPTDAKRFAVLTNVATPEGGQREVVYVTGNSGATWTLAAKLGSANKGKFYSWIRFGTDGTLGLMWHEQNASSSQQCPPTVSPEDFATGSDCGGDDVMAISSPDGGKTWNPSRRINPVTSLGGSVKPGDDCTCGMDVRAGAVHVVWTFVGPPRYPGGVLPSTTQEVWYGRYKP